MNAWLCKTQQLLLQLCIVYEPRSQEAQRHSNAVAQSKYRTEYRGVLISEVSFRRGSTVHQYSPTISEQQSRGGGRGGRHNRNTGQNTEVSLFQRCPYFRGVPLNGRHWWFLLRLAVHLALQLNRMV